MIGLINMRNYLLRRVFLHIDYYVFYLVLFSLPFGMHFLIPFLFGWICLVFFRYFFKGGYSISRFKGLLIIPIIFFLYHLEGAALSINLREGLFDLQVKLSLLLLPVLYPYQSEPYASGSRNFLWSFIIGCNVASIYYLGHAIYRSYSILGGSWIFNPVNGLYNYFLSSEFSYLIHPSYFALYQLVAILIIGNEFYRWWKGGNVVRVIILSSTFLLVTSLVLLQSRAGILGFGLLAIMWLFYLIQAKRMYKLGVSLMILLVGLSVFVFTQFDRLNYTAKSLEKTAEYGLTKPSIYDGTTIRIWIWKSALAVIENHPIFGVGTGDVRDELQKQYEKRGMSQAVLLRYNAHNQYLETWLGTGIFGLLGLLAMLFAPLWVGVKKGDWLLVGFLSLCSVSFMFESMLNTIAGVGFFAIFYTMLVSNLTIKRT